METESVWTLFIYLLFFYYYDSHILDQQQKKNWKNSKLLKFRFFHQVYFCCLLHWQKVKMFKGINKMSACTYSVWMLFIESNVPFANVWILLSYSDNKLKLVKSLNESFRIHEISFAFNSSNCNDVNPRNTFVGRFFILLPYKTLFHIEKVFFHYPCAFG